MLTRKYPKSVGDSLEGFQKINGKTFWGYTNNGIAKKFNLLEKVSLTKRESTEFDWGDYYVTKFEKDKVEDGSTKFLNLLYFNAQEPFNKEKSNNIEKPIALIFTGDAHDFFAGSSESYVVTKHPNGELLYKLLPELGKAERDKVFGNIGILVRNLDEGGVFPMDLGPSNFLVSDNYEPILIATPNKPNYPGEFMSAIQIRMHQRQKFKDSYGPLLSPVELDKYSNLILKKEKN